MANSDPQTLLLEVLGQLKINAWLVAILAIAGSAIGAFVSGYLRKYGEERALRENFSDIREQLKTTTRDTEEIKQYLSGNAWRSQQQWSAREKYYSQLLTQLHHFRIALEGLSDYYQQPGEEYTSDDLQGEHFKELLANAYEAYSEVKKLLGPATIFLSSNAVVSLEELFNEHWNLKYGAACTADYVSSAHDLALSAYQRILLEAKTHLGVESGA